jgi:hypothetical protein
MSASQVSQQDFLVDRYVANLMKILNKAIDVPLNQNQEVAVSELLKKSTSDHIAEIQNLRKQVEKDGH